MRRVDAAYAPPSRLPSSWGWWLTTLAMQAVVAWAAIVPFGDGGAIHVDLPELPASLTLILTVTCVLLRTRLPWAFLAVTLALNLIVLFVPQISLDGPGYLVAFLFAVYSVAATVRPNIAIIIGIVLALVLIPTNLIVRGMSVLSGVPLMVAATLTLSIAAGQISYARRRDIDHAEHRAAEAERTREAVAAARVAESRLATARDLHDAIGHQIAVINLQAGAAVESLPDHPREALRSLTRIQQSAETVIGEIGEMLRALREGDADRGETGAPWTASIAELIDVLAADGLQVDIEVQHDLPALPGAVEQSMHKVIQEGLLNVYKHGSRDTPALVRVTCEGTRIYVSISNLVPERSEAPPSTNYGVLGVRERVRALGGDAWAALAGDRFDLTVWIPLEETP